MDDKQELTPQLEDIVLESVESHEKIMRVDFSGQNPMKNTKHLRLLNYFNVSTRCKWIFLFISVTMTLIFISFLGYFFIHSLKSEINTENLNLNSKYDLINIQHHDDPANLINVETSSELYPTHFPDINEVNKKTPKKINTPNKEFNGILPSESTTEDQLDENFEIEVVDDVLDDFISTNVFNFRFLDQEDEKNKLNLPTYFSVNRVKRMKRSNELTSNSKNEKIINFSTTEPDISTTSASIALEERAKTDNQAQQLPQWFKSILPICFVPLPRLVDSSSSKDSLDSLPYNAPTGVPPFVPLGLLGIQPIPPKKGPTSSEGAATPVEFQNYDPSKYFAYNSDSNTFLSAPILCPYKSNNLGQEKKDDTVSESKISRVSNSETNANMNSNHFRTAVDEPAAVQQDKIALANSPAPQNNGSSNCPPNFFQCDDKSVCIPRRNWCDEKINCPDASDETKCQCHERINKNLVCDGYFDCPEGEDELGCFGCDEKSFSCEDWTRQYTDSKCLPISQRCDGLEQCQNGKDEMECSILTASFLRNDDSFKVGYSSGYLHKNYEGKWHPVCTPTRSWAIEACQAEIGQFSNDSLTIETVPVIKDIKKESYISMQPSGRIETVPDCDAHAVFVKCPPMSCGTRVTSDYDQVRSHDDLLVAARNPMARRAASNDIMEDEDLQKWLSKRIHDFSKPRIAGGKSSQPKSWPWMVAIYRDGKFICGSVVIDSSWIMTAAHCMEGYRRSYYQIVAGLYRRFSFAPMVQVRDAEYVILHPNYSFQDEILNDLALIKLKEPLIYNRWVLPTCLPNAPCQPAVNEICTVIGWGQVEENGRYPNELMEVDLQILSSCPKKWDGNKTMICAGIPQGGKDSCHGDSGGPLMCKQSVSQSTWYTAGIVSHGDGCARPDLPGVYTNLCALTPWIRETMKDNRTHERHRPLEKCQGFTCSAGVGKCLPKTSRCDKTVDCLDAEDEINCDNLTTRETVNKIDPENRNNRSESRFRAAGDNTEEIQPPVTRQQNEAGVKTTNETDSNVLSVNTTALPIDPSNFTGVYEGTTSQREITTTDATFGEIISTTTDFQSINFPDPEPPRFTCYRITQTIPIEAVCDKKLDCEDGTDEVDCNCREYLEQSYPAAICDGHVDCADHTDEKDCNLCNDAQFLCSRSGVCIPLEEKCNTVRNCPLNEDELDCNGLTKTTTIENFYPTVTLDADERPELRSDGYLINEIDGQWKIACFTEAIWMNSENYQEDFNELCNYLGFRKANVWAGGHEVYSGDLKIMRKKPLNQNIDLPEYSIDNPENCTASYLTCFSTPIAPMESFIYKHPTYQNETFMLPWESAIFVEGRYHCPATLLDKNWLLTTTQCTKNIDLNINHTKVHTGLSVAYQYVSGPHESILNIKMIKPLDGLNISLVGIDRNDVKFSRHTQAIFREKRFSAPTDFDDCITFATDPKGRMKVTRLKPTIDECDACHRCYYKNNESVAECQNNNTAGNWSGIVNCLGPSGWYPAAIFSDKDISCAFETPQALMSIDRIYARLVEAMDNTTSDDVQSLFCDGIRCQRGLCIPWKRVMDGISDCQTSEDESTEAAEAKKLICQKDASITCSCAKHELKCGNGECVSKETYCDKKPDCSDGTDEPATCNCAGYLNLTAPERLCDNIRHCYDKSDEKNHNCSCTNAHFKCVNSTNITCIPQDFVCDGEDDCENGEDELLCLTVKGLPGAPSGTGEVIRRTEGIWHTECHPTPVNTHEQAKKICLSLKYSGGSLMAAEEVAKYPNNSVILQKDEFYIIRPNSQVIIGFRNANKPLNTLVAADNCNRVFVVCT